MKLKRHRLAGLMRFRRVGDISSAKAEAADNRKTILASKRSKVFMVCSPVFDERLT
jgi:hypothetical protein